MPKATDEHGAPQAPPADVGFERVQAIADAVLYEGYLLYPYRGSATKNRMRWQFGLLAPRAWSEADGPAPPTVAGSTESWYQQTECLLLAEPGATLHVRVRCLRMQRRLVERHEADGRCQPVDRLVAGGETHLPFDEAVPHATDLVVSLADLARGERCLPVGREGGEDTEELPDGAGRLLRRRRPVEATTTLGAERLDPEESVWRLRIRTENTGTSVPPGAPREEALAHSLIATHTLIGGHGVTFGSLTDPPEWAAPHAPACANIHTFPVLAGADGEQDLMLSSPIILPDHPQVAPESPGDLHDSGEIDEILSLRTLLLTDEEKREARATDPRAAEIVDRVDRMPPEVFARLHGTIRSLRPSSAAVSPAAPEETRGAPSH